MRKTGKSEGNICVENSLLSTCSAMKNIEGRTNGTSSALLNSSDRHGNIFWRRDLCGNLSNICGSPLKN